MSMVLSWLSLVGLQQTKNVRHYANPPQAKAIGTAIVKYRSEFDDSWRVWFQASYWSIANGDGLMLKVGDRVEVLGYDNGNQLVVRTA